MFIVSKANLNDPFCKDLRVVASVFKKYGGFTRIFIGKTTLIYVGMVLPI